MTGSSRYANPPVPHEVNVAKTSAVIEFGRLLLASVAVCIVAVVAVIYGCRFAAPHVPFRYEQNLADSWFADFDEETSSPTRQYLQPLADALARHMNMPADMAVVVHISDNPKPNAFATLGGHVIVTRGLLESVDSENALAMVLAHEIAHIRHRDPLVSAGSGIVLAVLTAAVFGNAEFAWIGNSSTMLTQLHFSRAQESAADAAALEALINQYGHTRGAEGFFTEILKLENAPAGSDRAVAKRVAKAPEFLSTHPDTQARLRRIAASVAAGDQQIPLVALPDFLRQR